MYYFSKKVYHNKIKKSRTRGKSLKKIHINERYAYKNFQIDTYNIQLDVLLTIILCTDNQGEQKK